MGFISDAGDYGSTPLDVHLLKLFKFFRITAAIHKKLPLFNLIHFF